MQESRKSLSPVVIFRHVKEFVDKTNTYPLTADIIKINKDQMNELGDDDESAYPFARIDTGFPESHDQLAFMMDFFDNGVGVGFSGGDGTWLAYDELGDTAKRVSAVLTQLLTVFSNGQLKVLITNLEENDHMQAIEFIYRAPGKVAYDAIGTYDLFMSPKKLKNHTLKTTIFANNADIAEIKLDVPQIQKIILPDTDTEIMREIGRRNIRDLSEPLTPETLKQNIDDFSEKVGQKTAIKVGKKFDDFDESLGISGMSMREQFIHFARWRHIELMLWAFVMLTAHNWIDWTIATVNPAVLLLGASLIPLYVFRKRYPCPQILYLFAPLGYALFAIGAVVFLQNISAHLLTWVVTFFAVVAFLESIVFDTYFTRKKIHDKIYQWAKK